MHVPRKKVVSRFSALASGRTFIAEFGYLTKRVRNAGKTGSLGIKFRILTMFQPITFGNISDCLSFKFHFEDITKFIIMINGQNGNNDEKDHFLKKHAGGDEKLIYNK